MFGLCTGCVQAVTPVFRLCSGCVQAVTPVFRLGSGCVQAVTPVFRLFTGCVQAVTAVFRLCSEYSSRTVSHALRLASSQPSFRKVQSVAHRGSEVRSSELCNAALCTLPLDLTPGGQDTAPSAVPDIYSQAVHTSPKRRQQFTSRHMAAFVYLRSTLCRAAPVAL